MCNLAKTDSMVMPVQLGYVNAFLIKGERPVLVDTGMSKDSTAIMEKISSFGIDPKDISLILLTHCHFDHCGGVSDLKSRWTQR